MKKKISITLLTMISVVMLILPAQVAISAAGGEILPLMEQSIGLTTEEIREFDPALLAFMLTLLKIIAALFFSFTTALLILIYGPFRRGMRWASKAIFVPLTLWLVLAVMIYSSQPGAPWQIWAVLLGLDLVALGLTVSDKNQDT